MTRETDISHAVLRWLRSYHGSWAIKIHGERMQARTVDIHACVRGRFVAIELKVDPDEEPSRMQQYDLEQVRKAGGVAFVATSVEDVRREVRRIR